MSKNIITLLLIFSPITILAQKPQFDIHGRKLSYFVAIENKLKSEVFQSSGHYQDENLPSPVIFRRKETDMTDMLAYYFYNKADSTINHIIYEWDARNFYTEKLSSANVSLSTMAALAERYKQLYSQIKRKYGKSEISGNVVDLSNINLTSAGRSDDWLPDDSTRVTSYIELSDKSVKKDGVGIPPINSVRLFIYTLKPEPPVNPKTNEANVKQADSLFKTFIKAIATKDFTAARSGLSIQLTGKITDEQLENLAKSIRTGEELAVYMSGTQFDVRGGNFLMIQYKYSADLAHPPAETVKVIFDQANKILGVQPMKLMKKF